MKKTSKNQGYVTIIAVMIVSAIAIVVAATLVLLGLSSSRTSFSFEVSHQAKGLADACAEAGLEQIRNNTAYIGTGNLTFGQGSCTYNVTSQGGENRTITATGTVRTIVRKVKATINHINPSITIATWQEVVDII